MTYPAAPAAGNPSAVHFVCANGIQDTVVWRTSGGVDRKTQVLPNQKTFHTTAYPFSTARAEIKEKMS